LQENNPYGLGHCYKQKTLDQRERSAKEMSKTLNFANNYAQYLMKIKDIAFPNGQEKSGQ
jgi:hypothetical protein